MIDIGRLCVKTAGRDAGHTCIIVDCIDDHTVLIDGNVRRRTCNLAHLEPLAEKVELKKGASHDDVEKVFGELNLSVWKTNPKKAVSRPTTKRKMTAGKDASPTPIKPREEKKTATNQ